MCAPCREAFRGALILLDEGAISRAGFNGPYMESERQAGFVNFGTSHVMKLLGGGEGSQRLSWYQKWQVHLFPRPEALAGTVHNTLNGELSSPIHESLLENNELLDKVWALNQEQNANGEGTHLLSQVSNRRNPPKKSLNHSKGMISVISALALRSVITLAREKESTQSRLKMQATVPKGNPGVDNEENIWSELCVVQTKMPPILCTLKSSPNMCSYQQPNTKQIVPTIICDLLLGQAGRDGSPAHPSYPAGHAVQNGAFATLLKAR